MRYNPTPEAVPPQLSPPASIQARNTEYNLDLIGRVTHLDENGMVASFPVEIPEGTVLFTTIDLRSINSVVRGLIRIRSQADGLDVGGYLTFAEFVDLNDDERRKIRRQMAGEAAALRAQGAAVDGDQVAPVSPGSTLSRTRGRAGALRFKLPRITVASVIWVLLGMVFYTLLALSIIAAFPQGRHLEVIWFTKLWHAVGPTLRGMFK